MFRFIGVVFVFVLTVLVSPGLGQGYSVTPIVLSGEAAPTRTGELDLQTFQGFGRVSIDERGTIGFTANANDKAGGWIYSDGNLFWNNQRDEPIAETGVQYSGGSLPIPYDQGFGTEAWIENRTGAVAGPIDAPRSHLVPFRLMPGIGGGEGLHSADIFVSDNGQTGLRASYAGGEALWLIDHSVEELTVDHLVAQSGDSAPEISPTATFRGVSASEINNLGEAVTRVTYRTNDADNDILSSIWSFSSDTRRLLAKPNDAAPGTDSTFLSFYSAVNNDVGTTAFAATTQDGGTGLWLDIPGQDELAPVVLSGQTYPGIDSPVDSVSRITTINDRNEVSLGLKLQDQVWGGAWIASLTDGLTPVALQGEAAAGLDGWVHYRAQAPELNNLGLAVFESEVIPVDGNFRDAEKALFVRRPTGETTPLLRTGTEFEVSAGDIRTVEGFQIETYYDRGAMNDAGQIATTLQFENGTSGVFVFDFNDDSGNGGDPDPGAGAIAGVESSWKRSQGGLWNSDASWEAGVPNGVGHIATFSQNPVDRVTITLPDDKDITLGGLNYRSQVDGVSLRGDMSLKLAAESDAKPYIRTGPEAGRLEIQTHVDVAEEWLVDTQADSVLELNGELTGSSVTKTGTGQLRLGGDNASWNGEVKLEDGKLMVMHPNALGTPEIPTTIPAGTEVQFEVGETFEAIVLDGGRLTTAGGTPKFHGPVTLLHDSEIPTAYFLGDINGPGSLTVQGRSSILGKTTYLGETIVNDHLTIGHPHGLGSVDAPTYVRNNATLVATEDLLEHIIVEDNATLVVDNKGRYSGPITLQNGGTVESNTTSSGPASITVDGTGVLSGAGAYLADGIAGSGDIFFTAGAVKLGGPLSADVRLNVARNNRLSFDGPVTSDVPIELGGHLVIEHNASLTNINLHDQFTLSTTGDAILTFDSLPIGDGTYDLNLLTAEPIRVDGNATFKSLGNYRRPIFVDRGRLTVTGPTGLGSTTGTTLVASENAELVLQRGFDGAEVADKIRLDNAIGYGGTGGLHLYDVLLSGDLHLGDVGSIINSDNGSISGQIHGGGLTIKRNRLTLTGGGHTFTGEVYAHGGKLALAMDGQITEASQIVLEPIFAGSGNEGELLLNNQLVSHSDRVADNIPVLSYNGRIQLVGGGGRGVSDEERLGQVQLMSGHTDIRVSSDASLTIGELAREPRTTLELGFNHGSHLSVETTSSEFAVSNGILPAWLTIDSFDFATLNAQNHVVAIPRDQYVPIRSASETDNVLVDSEESTSNRSVNSLKFWNNGRLDIDGKLTIESGGVLLDNSTMSGGELTAGAGSNFDFYFHGRGGQIESQIVDNGTNPVGVVVDSQWLNMTGENTYTGGTVVLNTGILHLNSTNGIPIGGNVDVDGGDIVFAWPATGEVQIGHLNLRRGGRVLNEAEVTLQAQSIEVESGDIRVPLTGDGSLVKNGPGSADVADASQLTGPITINEGQLRIFDLPRTANVKVKENASLAVIENPGKVTLQGGSLSAGRYSGDVTVESDSFVRPFQTSSTTVRLRGQLLGTGNLLIEDTEFFMEGSSANYEGEIRLNNATLIPSQQSAIGSGGAYVGWNSRVVLGEIPIDGRVTLDGGAIVENSRSGMSAEYLGELHVATTGSISANQSIRGSNIKVNDIVMQPGATLTLNSTGYVGWTQGTIEIAGDLQVLGSAPTDEAANQTTLQVDTDTTISGTISGIDPRSELTVDGQFASTALASASYSVPHSGSALRVLDSSGDLLPLNLRDAMLSGNGTIHNSVVVGTSIVSPGVLSGVGRVGRLHAEGAIEFTHESILSIDLLDVTDTMGNGWDMLQASNGLSVANGTTVQIQSLNSDVESGPLTGFDPTAEFTLTIASGSISDPLPTVLVDYTDFEKHNTVPPLFGFSVRADDDSLVLDYGLRGDTNRDGLVDVSDIDFLCSSPEAFDLNNDGKFNAADVASYVSTIFATRPGDVDLDGTVQFADFLRLSQNFGESGGWAHGDFDCSGDVAFADFLLLSSNFGQERASQAVPEPNFHVVTLLSLLIALSRVLRATRPRSSA